MDVSATISVKPTDSEKPDRAKLEEAARLLKESGFEVTRIGRYGVSVTGKQDDFSRVLGVQAAPYTAMATSAKPAQRELGDLIDKVEVAPKPQLY
ncbi:MAG: hypothetical protein ACJ8D8_16040 [Microvirga sp.]